MDPYDLAIAYRVYPGVSKKPFVFADNKLALTELGIASLKESLGHLNAKIFCLLDGCPDEYAAIILRYFDAKDCEIIRLNKLGNLATFSLQIDILLKQQDAELVFFAEDDYMYLPGGLEQMVHFFRESSKEVHFVTPHDHLDYYQHSLHKGICAEIKIGQGKHWRTAAATCLTFLTSKAILHRTRKVFLTYNRRNYDFSIWLALTGHLVLNPLRWIRLRNNSLLIRGMLKAWRYSFGQCLIGRRWKLWVPITAAGTHMQFDELGPNVDWTAAAEALINKNSANYAEG